MKFGRVPQYFRIAKGLAPLLVSACWFSAIACSSEDPAAPVEDKRLLGGRSTVLNTSRSAYAQPLPGLTGELEEEFFVGNAIFNRGWVAAPASVVKFDGLGPLFNATNCSACHFRDGRGSPPVGPEESFFSLLLRLSVPGVDEHGGPLGEPTYGGQLQGSSISGVEREGVAVVKYTDVEHILPDGERVMLRAPVYEVKDLSAGPMESGTMISPRVAPAVFGLGLLEAVEEATLLLKSDPDDLDGDGISGKPNWVWDAKKGARALGRFGWKSNQPSIAQQVAGAFNGDMGLTTFLFAKDDCTEKQANCRAAISGGAPEVDEGILSSVIDYSHLLAVPARRDVAATERGETLFAQSGCDACHVTKIQTGNSDRYPLLNHDTIRPYTDLLLHDMGDRLADGRPDFDATGTEWRTAPLWGLGLLETVNRHTFLLHDGRARSILEAIVWHDGEAKRSRETFETLPKKDRDAMIAFLRSL